MTTRRHACVPATRQAARGERAQHQIAAQLAAAIRTRAGDTDDVAAARRAEMAAELTRHERRSEGAAA